MILDGDKGKVEQFKIDWSSLTREELIRKYHRSWATLRNWVCDLDLGGLRPHNGIRRQKEVPYELPSFDDLIDLAIREKDLVGGYFHQGTWVEKDIATTLPIAITFTADWHLGSLGVDYEAFDRDMKLIRDVDGLYAYVGGDSEQNIINTNFAVRFEQQVPFRQKALFIRTMEMIKDKVVALGTGNHNDWSKAADGIDQIAEIARSLNIIYTQNGGMLELFVGNVLYRIFRVHKARFNSVLNLTHSIKRCWEFAPDDFDIGIVEHKHLAAIEPFDRHGEEKWAVRTGTYLTQDDFARSNGVWGIKVANPTVILYPDQKKIIGMLHMEDAIRFLKSERKRMADEKPKIIQATIAEHRKRPDLIISEE